MPNIVDVALLHLRLLQLVLFRKGVFVVCFQISSATRFVRFTRTHLIPVFSIECTNYICYWPHLRAANRDEVSQILVPIIIINMSSLLADHPALIRHTDTTLDILTSCSSSFSFSLSSNTSNQCNYQRKSHVAKASSSDIFTRLKMRIIGDGKMK